MTDADMTAAQLSKEKLRLDGFEHLRQASGFCKLLGRLYYEELTDELIEELASGLQVVPIQGAAEGEERAYVLGNNKMVKYLLNRNPDTLTESRCDYARVFLGAGQLSESPIAPFESVYTGEERILMQDSRDEVFQILRQDGLVIDDRFNMPEDHIAFEFQYLALKADEACLAAEAGDEEAAFGASGQFERFFADHVADWVPRFCDEAIGLARTPFYQGLLQMTKAWVVLEGEALGV